MIEYGGNILTMHAYCETSFIYGKEFKCVSYVLVTLIWPRVFHVLIWVYKNRVGEFDCKKRRVCLRVPFCQSSIRIIHYIAFLISYRLDVFLFSKYLLYFLYHSLVVRIVRGLDCHKDIIAFMTIVHKLSHSSVNGGDKSFISYSVRIFIVPKTTTRKCEYGLELFYRLHVSLEFSHLSVILFFVSKTYPQYEILTCLIE